MTDPITVDPTELVINSQYLLPIDPAQIATMRCGNGEVDIDLTTGAPVQVRDLEHPERIYLLDAGETFWHSVEHQWGSGHVTTDRGSGRWHTPSSIEHRPAGSRAVHTPVDGLSLVVTRTYDQTLHETFQLTNDGQDDLVITGLGIQTPFADFYDGAQNSLARAVHAHLFTGGATAWALAQPMSGTGRLLGLVVREGALHAYSVESRNQNTSSNVRGHLVLHVTDHARNEHAFAGQPVVRLSPGETFTLAWEIGWFESVEGFVDAVDAPARFESYSAPIGGTIRVHSASAPVLAPGAQATVTAVEGGFEISSQAHGLLDLDVAGMSTQVAFHLPLDEVVRRRVRYILAHQMTPERPGLLAHGMVPVDTRTLVTHSTNGWSDWSDGSERIAMPVLLQLAAEAGWVDDDGAVTIALEGWAQLARTHLLDESAAPRRGSQFQHSGPRLYDAPWLAQFFHDRSRILGELDDLDLAARILERAVELGSAHHLSIHLSETCMDVAQSLEETGSPQRAAHLREALVASARSFADMGTQLPGHEVSYEQSMVAPLINLLTDAHTITGEQVFLDAITARLPWLLAFGGPQPHVRLNAIAIRHWDGYWFGSDRQWGDVFPHHWSALTSTALLRLPAPLRTAQTYAIAQAILGANMVNYAADGSATCAFVMPSAVDARPAHAPDPLANDQDWHLIAWIRALATTSTSPLLDVRSTSPSTTST